MKMRTMKTGTKPNGATDKAKRAVRKFDKLREELSEKQRYFEINYPDAQLALNDIKATEDEARSLIDPIKVLVREAGQTVGDFKLTPKTTNPGYKPDELLGTVCEMDDELAGSVLKDLFNRGVITAFAVDKSASRMLRTVDEDMAAKLKDAWDPGGSPLTSSVSTPKF